MTHSANSYRGEATLTVDGTPQILRPSFAALVSAEDELGPLFALVERAGDGQLKLAEMAGLFWHCLEAQDQFTRDQIEAATIEAGLAGCAKPLRALLGAILQGAG
ncbi:gene transfer agent family protein [Pontixanthobacter aquaemixtae]|uniref:Gene transfer agent family protein n=1 Tax=Pontixanthobacter aquaemixtae TaxID=1958940 RepID=A0A844ZTM9_9SPHN|nr:gene transfer agent family protein [Pontixanthobacter aquaemixtae]MXO91225.1 gene transfer agent family protein [Pontixanthobacter aquaemixtae]